MIFRIVLSVALLVAQGVRFASAEDAPASTAKVPETSLLVPMIDVELSDGGTMTGTLTTRRGEPIGTMDVALRTSDGIVVPATTNANGEFAYRGLVGGLYQLETENSATMCRVWAKGTAPPNSPVNVLLVRGDDVAAGQWSPPGYSGNVVRGFTRAMANPITATLIVGAAVGIPVAIHNANKDDNGS